MEMEWKWNGNGNGNGKRGREMDGYIENKNYRKPTNQLMMSVPCDVPPASSSWLTLAWVN